MICSVENCLSENKVVGSVVGKLCSLHYQRFYKHGDPLKVKLHKAQKEGDTTPYMCRTCKIVKSFDQFYVSEKRRKTECKECSNAKYKLVGTAKRRTPEAKRTRLVAHLKRNYNLSIEEYDLMCKEQDNKCYLCKRGVKLCVDHDHATGKVRHLLCAKCNSFLGWVEVTFSGNTSKINEYLATGQN